VVSRDNKLHNRQRLECLEGNIPTGERVGNVDWSQYQTAYGVAIDVPKQLERLASKDEDVARQEIARLAGVGARNVSHVKTILEKAHPRLIDALQDGTLSIHRGVQWCSLSCSQQLGQLLSYAVERATSKVARPAVTQLSRQRRGRDAIPVVADSPLESRGSLSVAGLHVLATTSSCKASLRPQFNAIACS
jgi:hypothetical protein